jgi:hypothetical protein
MKWSQQLQRLFHPDFHCIRMQSLIFPCWATRALFPGRHRQHDNFVSALLSRRQSAARLSPLVYRFYSRAWFAIPYRAAIRQSLTYILSEHVGGLTLGRARVRVSAAHLFSNTHIYFGEALQKFTITISVVEASGEHEEVSTQEFRTGFVPGERRPFPSFRSFISVLLTDEDGDR